MKIPLCVLSMGLIFGNSFAQTLFTSVQNGNWEDCNTWGTCPGTVAGIDFPGENDDVIIAHTITINNTLDNDTNATQEQPDNFAGVCGSNHEGCGTNSFYLNGKITINNSGTFYTTVPVIIADTLEINAGGAYFLDDNNDDTFVIGFLDVKDNGSFLTEDCLSLSGNGVATVSELGINQSLGSPE